MTYDIEISGSNYRVEIALGSESAFKSGTARCLLNDSSIELNFCWIAPGVLSLIIDGTAHRCILDASTSTPSIQLQDICYPYILEDPRSLRKRHRHGAGLDGPRPLKASMPGRIVRIMAELNSEVVPQQPILAIEAMKMQNELRSPKAGRLTRLLVSVGDTVQADQTLAIIE